MRTAFAIAFIATAGVLSGTASAQRPDDRFQQRQDDRIPTYNSDTQQLGYEHGYRDGADRGRQDRDRRLSRNTPRDNDYLDSARYSYQSSFGNRRDYMDAYRDGFQAGYDDGFNYYDRPGRYGQIYGGQQSNGRPQSGGREQFNRRDQVNQSNRGGSIQRPPFDSGYRE